MFFNNPCFQAFDGSSQYFKRLGVYDLDCCYLPGGFRPDDGYYILEKVCNCCGKCTVVESVRWYAANGYPVGAVINCPTIRKVNSPINSATKVSLIVDGFCCNADGSKVYAELTMPCDGNPLP